MIFVPNNILNFYSWIVTIIGRLEFEIINSSIGFLYKMFEFPQLITLSFMYSRKLK